jgi:hypothetical protein
MTFTIREYLIDQLNEIDKFKFELGIKMNKDPLSIYTMNEIYEMWIITNAKKFREDWILKHNGVNCTFC